MKRGVYSGTEEMEYLLSHVIGMNSFFRWGFFKFIFYDTANLQLNILKILH